MERSAHIEDGRYEERRKRGEGLAQSWRAGDEDQGRRYWRGVEWGGK